MKVESIVINNIRRGIAEEIFCANVQKRIAELGMLYIRNIKSAMELAETKEDYDLLISAIVEFYNHEINKLKEICKLHHVSEAKIKLLFNGIGGGM